MRRIALVLLFLLFSATAFGQRLRVDLNRNWAYTPGWEVRLRAGQTVDLPHTWNLDAQSGKADYFRGMGNYVKTIEIPKEWTGKRVFIRFGGANSVCDLYVNGSHVGQHKGGYTAFGWEITPYLNSSGRNTFWVRVNNAQDIDLAPLVGDFNVYGGLYRGVELFVIPDAYISGEDYGSDGLYVLTTDVSEERADVHASMWVRGTRGAMVTTTLTLHDDRGNTLDSLTRRVKLDNEGKSRVAAAFAIANPRLWNGVKDPYLYRIKARVSNTKGYDEVTQNFGVRSFRVDDKNRFYLNDQPYPLRGVVRIEDWAGLGNALHRENHRRDIEWIREMGANAVRLAYFPNDPYFIELCDKAGVLVWSELPLVGAGPYRNKGYNNSEAYQENARGMMRQMMAQLYNHPSIVWWGLFDQLTQQGDDPLPLIKELDRMAKEDGGGRLTVAASNQDGELNFATDLIGFNQFLGWFNGRTEDFEGWTKDLRRGFPKLKSGVSGYGAGASIYQHSDSLVKPDCYGTWHPEQWQAHQHEEYWRVISGGDHFWGTFAWAMFDYGAAHRTDGERDGINDIGLVTFDRRVGKDAFYFYKANWNTEDPFVYITDRRWDVRSAERQRIKVYSNQPSVELFVNGVSLGIKDNDGLGRFIWEGVKLKVGDNTIEALHLATEKMDRITVTVKPQATLLEVRYSESGTGAARRRERP